MADNRPTLAEIAQLHTHYGDPKAATRHFITQRVTGALGILFTGFFVWLVVRLAGADRADFVAVMGNPVIAVITALLVLTVAIHMRIGMREIIDDYISEPGLYRLSRTLNTFFCVAITLIAFIALAKIVFWG
jgi:succinate dehydrogenase / fumarate reductase membrane anchor subunit